jgi:hypothetical protein
MGALGLGVGVDLADALLEHRDALLDCQRVMMGGVWRAGRLEAVVDESL